MRIVLKIKQIHLSSLFTQPSNHPALHPVPNCPIPNDFINVLGEKSNPPVNQTVIDIICSYHGQESLVSRVRAIYYTMYICIFTAFQRSGFFIFAFICFVLFLWCKIDWYAVKNIKVQLKSHRRVVRSFALDELSTHGTGSNSMEVTNKL